MLPLSVPDSAESIDLWAMMPFFMPRLRCSGSLAQKSIALTFPWLNHAPR